MLWKKLANLHNSRSFYWDAAQVMQLSAQTVQDLIVQSGVDPTSLKIGQSHQGVLSPHTKWEIHSFGTAEDLNFVIMRKVFKVRVMKRHFVTEPSVGQADEITKRETWENRCEEIGSNKIIKIHCQLNLWEVDWCYGHTTAVIDYFNTSETFTLMLDAV